MIRLENRWRYSLIIAIIILYVVVNMMFTIRGVYYFNFIPVVLFFLYLALARTNLFYFAVIFFTPLSIQFIHIAPGSPVDFAIPTEPMLLGMLLLLTCKVAYQGIYREFTNPQFLNHPVTYAILFYLFWMMVTCITSVDPLVSFKYLLAHVWFIAVFYFFAATLFSKVSNIRFFIWCYVAAMILVIFYTLYRHWGHGLLDRQAAQSVMSPFFRDHTSYGAILAMLIFAFGGMVMYVRKSGFQRLLYWGSMIIVLAGLVFSYTRAAWISVFCALAILFLMLLKIKFRLVMVMGAVMALILFIQKEEIIEKVQQNQQASSSSLVEHLQSVTNITTDESNLERINRWNSAIRMFKEKPFLGWGPGTYMFEYAPFQVSGEMTGISTNFGDLGNTHSEYLGALSESGALGFLSFVLVAVLSVSTGFRVYNKIKKKRLKILALGMVLGLLTYLIHGVLNNFLDTDKASALFWGFTAALVSLDLRFVKRQDPEKDR